MALRCVAAGFLAKSCSGFCFACPGESAYQLWCRGMGTSSIDLGEAWSLTVGPRCCLFLADPISDPAATLTFCCFLGFETLIFWLREQQYCDLFNRSGLLSLLVAKNSYSEPETISWEETMDLLHSSQHRFFCFWQCDIL